MSKEVLEAAISDALDASRSALRLIYIMSGAPRGNTDEGFQQWLDEGRDEDIDK